MKENVVKKAVKSNNGFTLIELLIVVLIIGVLSAVALPGYRKATEKSKAAEALTLLSDIAAAEHRYVLLSNEYSSDFDKLDLHLGDVAQIDNDILTTKNFELTVSEGMPNVVDTAYIRAYRKNPGSPTVLYSLFRCIDSNKTLCLDEDTTDIITCETLGFESEADRMDPCGGNPVNNADGCNATGGFWATGLGTCFSSAQERCDALSGVMNNNICTFNDNDLSITDQILDNDMACYGNVAGTASRSNTSGYVYDHVNRNWYTVNTGACLGSVINDGGICYANNASAACGQAIINDGGICETLVNGGCVSSTINDGGVCHSGEGSTKGCYYATINKGGLCNATGFMGCHGSIMNDGGICKGTGYQWACKEPLIHKGGICIGAGYESCQLAVVEDGGIMVAQTSTAGYGASYSGSGCCVDCTGSGYCHNSGHICQVTDEEKERYCNM